MRCSVFLATLTGLAAGADAVHAQDLALPFAAGETLVYDASAGVVGKFGDATMYVAGPEPVRDRSALRLSFDMSGRVVLFSVRDRTRSWIDPQQFSTLRFEKTEHSPLGNWKESVSVFPDEQRWTCSTGSHVLTNTAPALDELSAIYYVRTLPLLGGDDQDLTGHFDALRNPIRVRVLGRGHTTVPVGTFATIDVEMRVRSPQRFQGEGVVRMQLTDDDRRIPVRIRTDLPGRTAVTLDLRALTYVVPAAQ